MEELRYRTEGEGNNDRVSDTLEFIAGDSTNSITDYKGGLFHFLEDGEEAVLDCVAAPHK